MFRTTNGFTSATHHERVRGGRSRRVRRHAPLARQGSDDERIDERERLADPLAAVVRPRGEHRVGRRVSGRDAVGLRGSGRNQADVRRVFALTVAEPTRARSSSAHARPRSPRRRSSSRAGSPDRFSSRYGWWPPSTAFAASYMAPEHHREAEHRRVGCRRRSAGEDRGPPGLEPVGDDVGLSGSRHHECREDRREDDQRPGSSVLHDRLPSFGRRWGVQERDGSAAASTTTSPGRPLRARAGRN